MFTGIIEGIGALERLEPEAEGGARLMVRLPENLPREEFALGDSVSVNGVCLTVAEIFSEGLLGFEAVLETMRRTNLGDLRAGDRVNLERALLPTTRMGGHLVQGHVDTTARIIAVEPEGNGRVFRYQMEEPAYLRYVVSKGSIAVDGVSLTVVEVDSAGFSVWIVPFTWEHTNFGARRVGDRVNIETDILARYLEKWAKMGSEAGTIGVYGDEFVSS